MSEFIGNAVGALIGGQAIGALSGAGALVQSVATGDIAPALISSLGRWAWGLQRASWRGIPFAVRQSQIRRGRRVVVHQYPFRDDVWIEDLGKGLRQINFQGFLVGDDVYAKRDAFSVACDLAGPGVLVHPSLGALSVTNVGFASAEFAERGRFVALDLTFIETRSGLPIFPGISIATIAGTLLSATGLETAAFGFFQDQIDDLGARAGPFLQSAAHDVGDTIGSAISGIGDFFGF